MCTLIVIRKHLKCWQALDRWACLYTMKLQDGFPVWDERTDHSVKIWPKQYPTFISVSDDHIAPIGWVIDMDAAHIFPTEVFGESIRNLTVIQALGHG